MAKKNSAWLCMIVFVLAILALQAVASTDDLDARALRHLFRALNSPDQLQGWKSDGGDPCQESWTGVSCSDSSVIHLRLHGLGLAGFLGLELSNLLNLKLLDLGSNNIQGEIPSELPINITHLNLAENNFTKNLPHSLVQMKHLRHLNLSQNLLSGPLEDMFGGLENLREMDLSFNHFSGDLPISFSSLSNLTRLFLQNNEFTGSVVYLSDLPLSDLNIQDNHFSGVIPEHFQSIHNLWIGGNRFNRETNYPPWNFPLDVNPNVTTAPATNLSSIAKFPPQETKKKKSGAVGLVLTVGGGTLMAACAAFFIVHRIRRSRRPILRTRQDSVRSLASSQSGGFPSMAAEDSPHISGFSSSPMITPSRLPPIRTKTMKVSRRKSFSMGKLPIRAKPYTVAELQSATNSFSEENFLGDGSIGSVYRAKFPDGQILAVKNINTVPLSIAEEEQFLDVIRAVSQLRHPNIVRLAGYCVEHGQHLLVYDYIRNLTVEDALHCAAYKPLSWGQRLKIALGIARALKYMHSSCVPPIAHSNLKAANILLDEELKPRLCDCGLAILRPLTSNSVKLKASEMAIADSGYVAPEHIRRGSGDTKADVYAFGVLLLELLTGRKPFDSLRPTTDQSLVNWASSRLHDSESLGQMVDPTIRRTFSSKTLSHFADIITLCIQGQKEFRPSMSEIVESLMSLLQKPGAADGNETDPFDRSFRSTNSHFFGSPTMSYYSM